LVPISCSTGLFGYPRSDERWKAHQELKDQPGVREKLCAERGWKTDPPVEVSRAGEVPGTYFFGGGTALIGLISLIYWQRQRKSTIRNDESGYPVPWGTNILMWRSRGSTKSIGSERALPTSITRMAGEC
jgi:hypothetical protein